MSLSIKPFLKFLYGYPRRLRYITRFATYPRCRDESVAEHSYYVALNAYMLTLYLIGKGYIVDVHLVLGKALMHDIEESFTGDVNSLAKRETPELDSLLRVAGNEAVRDRICAILPDEVADMLSNHWLKAKGDGIEGQIVHVADLLSITLYAMEEELLGNKAMPVIRMRSLDWIEELGYDWLQPLKAEIRDRYGGYDR